MPGPAPLPSIAPGLFSTGMAHLEAGRVAEAEASLLQVIAAHPRHAAAWHFLGAAQLRRGEAQKAVRAMRRALRLLPMHPTWWENLARAEHAAGNDENAKKAWMRGQMLRARQTEAVSWQKLPGTKGEADRTGPPDA